MHLILKVAKKIAVIFPFFLWCFYNGELVDNEEESFTDHFHEVLNESAIFLQAKYNVRFFGFGIDPVDEFVNMLELNFELDRELRKEEIRLILIEMAQDFLEIINSRKELAPYMINYPFTVKNIDIIICFNHEDGTPIDHPGIGIAAIEHCGILRYTTLDSKHYYHRVTREEEDFEEVLNLIRGYKTHEKKDVIG
jgi:hypothetical protein